MHCGTTEAFGKIEKQQHPMLLKAPNAMNTANQEHSLCREA